MQCAKFPRPTTNVNAQITITDPVIECDPDTSHAAVAMIHPATTPLQKIVLPGWCTAASPSPAIACTTSAGSACVNPASAANASAPSMFEGSTVNHSRSVFQICRGSVKTSATGYNVFSVNSCERPRITTMNPSG